MKGHHRAIIALLLLVLMSIGCQHYEQLSLEVRDAESHAPVQTPVVIGYPIGVELRRAVSLFSPNLKRDHTHTDEQGRATIRVADNESWFIWLEPVEKQYCTIQFETACSDDTWQTLKAGRWWRTTGPAFSESPMTLDLEVRVSQ